jgi:hypothetical protein
MNNAIRLSLAKIISFILNPLIVIIFLPFFLVYKETHDLSGALHWTYYTMFFLAAIAGIVLFAVKKKIFTDMDVSKREQRPLLFDIALLFGVTYLTCLVLLQAPYLLLLVTSGILGGIIVVSIINTKIKASIHVATMTALALTVAIGYGGYFYLLLLLIPLLIWARVKTKRHTMAEAITGSVVGAFLSLAVYSVYVAIKEFIM